jgi:hypothetical protein
MNDYYVYVYIDPRNYEEFYYGQGKNNRKDAHLKDHSDSEKTKIIEEIRNAGQKPIIRVIASGLTKEEALLVEKTLLWKLGKWTTNISKGTNSEKFRPHNSFHEELCGFDYYNGIFYYNIGEGIHRSWKDYCKHGFISAGQGTKWRDAMLGFNPGDVVVAYLKGYGFVGIGRILTKAKMVNDIRINGHPLLSLKLNAERMYDNCESEERSEYVCEVKWLRKVKKENAYWKSYSGLYTTTHIRASLGNQKKTIRYLESKFGINLYNLI